MNGYAGERLVVGTLLAANWSACPVFGPNERLVPPSPSTTATPASCLAWDLSYDSAEQVTMDGGDQVNGSIDFTVCQERGTGDAVVRAHMDRLDALFKAVNSGAIFFRTGEPGDYDGEDPLYRRLYSIPFIRFDVLGAEDLATLAGVGSTSRTVAQSAHGFAVGNWVAWDSVANAFIKGLAAVGEPRALGVVSAVPGADAFVFVPTGAVSLLGVTYTDGNLFLSAITRGAATSALPASDSYSQLLAVAIGPHDLIVLCEQPEDRT